MSHFYARNENGEPELIESVTTIPQSRKFGRPCFSSVTTKLAIMKTWVDTNWGPSELARHAEENPRSPDWEFSEWVDWLKKKVYKEYTRNDGKVFFSSDFGIAVHKELENWCGNHSYEFAPEWEMYARRFPLYCADNGIEIVEAEKLVICDRLKTAGSIDVDAKQDGRYILMDHKCRQGKKKYYDKDIAQLAIESKMIKEERNLDYLPRICSNQIDVTDGQHYPKWWSEAEQQWGIEYFEAVNHAYNVANKIHV